MEMDLFACEHAWPGVPTPLAGSQTWGGGAPVPAPAPVPAHGTMFMLASRHMGSPTLVCTGCGGGGAAAPPPSHGTIFLLAS